MRSLGNLDTMAFCTCGYFPLLPFRIVLSNSRPDYKVFSNLVAGRRNHVVLISPTRLILMTSGEVDDAHLSALRPGLRMTSLIKERVTSAASPPPSGSSSASGRKAERRLRQPWLAGQALPLKGLFAGCSTDLSPDLR